MITLRMVAIALALLLGGPVVFALADGGLPTVPGGEIFDVTADVAATIEDIMLVEPPETYERQVISNAPEQLVEGHTVFVTWDIPLIKNVTNWTLDIMGDVDCKLHHSSEGVFVGPIPVPTRINEAHVECHAAGRGFVTPDPFIDPERTHRTPLVPTGREYPFTAPDGQRAKAVEYSYYVIREDELTGMQTAQLFYGWASPYLRPWQDVNGKEKDWYCPLPVDRLMEMGLTDFYAYSEDELAARGLSLPGE